ncbi:MAG: sulfotransferase domain-containing protein [Caldilineaceae bacterium]|nr:sulfotransferase domain-containing protein [Caldilineaceae bacterium]
MEITTEEPALNVHALPQVTRTYQNHILDSTHWDHYVPRDDDIVIATSIKSGTTWMQHIILRLIFLEQEFPPTIQVSPWLDTRFRPLETALARLEAQEHRRCIKTHLPLDGLPFFPQVKYVVVGRSPLDVFMSLWNHYSNHPDEFIAYVNQLPGRVGDPFPAAPKDIHAFWQTWINRGWFAWEEEGYPYWGNMHHTQTWWNYRHLTNVFFVHFNDLLANLEGEIQIIASFLEMEVSAESIAKIAQAVRFPALKQKAIADEKEPSKVFKGGASTFFYKGTNGRWKGVLSEDELAMCEATKSRVLTPGCARWLEQGRVALR